MFYVDIIVIVVFEAGSGTVTGLLEAPLYLLTLGALEPQAGSDAATIVG